MNSTSKSFVLGPSHYYIEISKTIFSRASIIPPNSRKATVNKNLFPKPASVICLIYSTSVSWSIIGDMRQLSFLAFETHEDGLIGAAAGDGLYYLEIPNLHCGSWVQDLRSLFHEFGRLDVCLRSYNRRFRSPLLNGCGLQIFLYVGREYYICISSNLPLMKIF
jgi:hypothetical protein